MGRRSVHSSEELRELILNAAQGIIERNGIAGLSAREIARLIGYSPGTLYNIFENLDDVLLTLQIRLLGRVVESLRQVPTDGDYSQNLQGLAGAYVAFALENARLWNLLFCHSLPPGHPVPQALHDNVNGIVDTVRNAMSPLDMPAEQKDFACRALWAGVHGITAIAVTEKGPNMTSATAQQYAAFLTATFLNGLQTQLR